MPRFKNKNKTGTVRVSRPDGARFSVGESEVYFSRDSFPTTLHICVGLATERAMYSFYQEFGCVPTTDFVVETVVTGRKITTTVMELEVIRDDGADSEVQQPGHQG